jgi:hypothetical protein
MLPSVHYPLICRQLHLCLGLPKSLPLIYRSIILAVSGNYLVASGLKLALRARAVLNGNYKLEAHTLLTRIMICVFTRSALCAQPLLCAAQRAFEAASQNIHHTHTYKRHSHFPHRSEESRSLITKSEHRAHEKGSRLRQKILKFRLTQSGGFWMTETGTGYISKLIKACVTLKPIMYILQVRRVMRPVCKFQPRWDWIKKEEVLENRSRQTKKAFVWPCRASRAAPSFLGAARRQLKWFRPNENLLRQRRKIRASACLFFAHIRAALKPH